MSHNEIQSHFAGKVTEEMSTVLSTLMEVIKNNKSIKLTPDQKNVLALKKDEVKLSSKSVVEIYRNRLRELWEQYVEPVSRKAEVEAAYNRWVRSQRKSFKAVKDRKTRNEQANEDREKRAEEADEAFADNLFEPVKEEGEICYGMNLKTLTIDYNQPLQFTGKIELRLIEDCIMISPLTKIVDITKTLKKILIKGTKYGWTRVHIGTLLKFFVKEHLSMNYTCLAYLEDPTEIWESVSNLIDFSSAEATILHAMKALTRKKTHGIATVVGAYKSLAFDLHEIKSPYASKVDCLKEADKDAVKICKYFIEPNLFTLLKGITDKIKYEEKRKITLDEMTELINRYEMSPDFRPKTDKSLDKFDVSQVSIFLCDPEIVGGALAASASPAEVHVAGEEHVYDNIGGTSSASTLRKDSEIYKSSSSLSSGGWSKSGQPTSHQERGRKPNKGSPFTGRKRLYINKNGERRSISRGRLETWDDKNQKFVPRQLSRSGERKSKSPAGKLCLLCNAPHPGICHFYGKIKPTKEECSECGGRHPKSICLGRRSLTPGGTVRSPSSNRSSSRDPSKDKGDKDKSKDWFPTFRKGN